MATARDGAAPYQGGGAGGKFGKRPIRRSAPATPYDRPPTGLRNNSSSLFAKLVDPASRLIYAGANRLFGVFQKRLPYIPSQRPPETNEEPRNGLQEAGPNDCIGVLKPSTDQGVNLASISATTEISELEDMLKQKTFTRCEIERLTALLHSRTNESPSDDIDERDGSKLPGTTSHLLRLEASTSGPVKKHGETENFHAAISTPVVNSRVLEEDVASPAELAKAYMGTRPAKVSSSTLMLGSQSLRQDSVSLNNTTVLPKTPIVSLAPKTAGSFRGLENGFTTPRSRGRSAIYNMARTPYYRGPSAFSHKGIDSDHGHGLASPSVEHEEPFGSSKMALKHRRSVLDDNIGSGGPLRRIRQKAYLPSQGSSLSKHRRESGSSDFAVSQKLLLRNETKPKVSKAVEENGETSTRSSGYYASVPTKSTQMASKILKQLERLSPKEKLSGSRIAGTNEKSPATLTSNMIHGQALRSMEKVDSPKLLHSLQDNQKSEESHARESSQSKDKVEENGPRKFAVPRNVLSSMNGNSTVPVRDSALIVTNTDSTLKLPVEPPQKKRAFQMSAHEDSLEVDDDNHSNWHISIPFGENKKLETPLIVNKDVSPEAPPKVIQTFAMPEVFKTSPPEVANLPALPAFKIIDDATISPKTDFGPSSDSVLNEQKSGFNFVTTSPPSTINNTQSAAPSKEPKAFPTFGTSTKNDEKVTPFLFSANESSGFKQNASPDAKPLSSSSLFNSVTKNDPVQFSVSNKDDNGQKSVNMFGKSESLSSGHQSTSTNSVFSFGVSTNKSSVSNVTPASGTKTNNLFISSASSVSTPVFSFASATASTTSTSMAEAPETNATKSPFASTGSSPIGLSSLAAPLSTTNNQFGSSAPSAPAFSFGFSSGAAASEAKSGGSAANVFGSSLTTTPSFGPSSTVASSETKSNVIGSSLTATPSFGLSSTVAPSETKSNVFGSATPSFGLSSTVAPSETKSNVFGSATPSFGLSSTVALSETKSNVFGSLTATPSFGLSSTVAPSETKSNVFGSSLTATPSFGLSSTLASSETKSNVFGTSSTPFSFGVSSTSSSFPIVSGSGGSTFLFGTGGAKSSSFPSPSQRQSVFGNSTPNNNNNNNNDQTSMEDSMAEDSMQTASPPLPAGGPGGFMFGSGLATQTPQTVPFQFGGQASQAQLQNPFQASGSLELNNGGGSFSLGSGGGDKSGRRIVRVNKSKNRRK